MDPGTGLTLLGGAIGSAKLIERLLGPTADYLGEGLRTYAEKAVENLGRIMRKSVTILGPDIEKEGRVPPPVLKEVLDHGSFCEDDLSCSYFAGVLASSRTESGRDDRGKTMASLIGRLSSYQIRTHYVAYVLFKELYDGQVSDCATDSVMESLGLRLPSSVLNVALELDDSELERASVLVGSALQGLYREMLIHNNWTMMTNPAASADYETAIRPEICGYELFLWAHGMGDMDVCCFLDKALHFRGVDSIVIPEGYSKLKQE